MKTNKTTVSTYAVDIETTNLFPYFSVEYTPISSEECTELILPTSQLDTLVALLSKTISDNENIARSYKRLGKLTKDEPKISQMYYNKHSKTRKLVNKLAKIQHNLKTQR